MVYCAAATEIEASSLEQSKGYCVKKIAWLPLILVITFGVNQTKRIQVYPLTSCFCVH